MSIVALESLPLLNKYYYNNNIITQAHGKMKCTVGGWTYYCAGQAV